MSRSKRDILETEEMLRRLTGLLVNHGNYTDCTLPRRDAEALRRISMTLHRWHELECNEDIRRGVDVPGNGFTENEKGKTFLFTHGQIGGKRHYQISDREAGALKRLKTIMARYPALQAYVQGDPRGCALYILRPGDVPEGKRADAYYSRGLAVFK